ncbi:MAG: hypothetical protein CBB71_23355 [Rhodopirellula sp. TMED11]|nr:MAG: hypothetical protein CBB71_23355 [Rhodopirellula sp. TMED11]
MLSEVEDPAPTVIKKAKRATQGKEPGRFTNTDIRCAAKGCKNSCNKVRGSSDMYLTTCDKCFREARTNNKESITLFDGTKFKLPKRKPLPDGHHQGGIAEMREQKEQPTKKRKYTEEEVSAYKKAKRAEKKKKNAQVWKAGKESLAAQAAADAEADDADENFNHTANKALAQVASLSRQLGIDPRLIDESEEEVPKKAKRVKKHASAARTVVKQPSAEAGDESSE